MAKVKVDPTVRKAIRDAQKMIRVLYQEDANEAETRRRVERLLETLMGYDPFTHITREHAVRSTGDADYCDFAVVLDDKKKSPDLFIEIKRVGIDLQVKHIKQAAGYAINAGCEWVVLTNTRQWHLYHISFGQPPETQVLEKWNLLEDDVPELAAKFELIGLRSLTKGDLDVLWTKRNVLTPQNLLKVFVGEDGLKLVRRELKKSTGVTLSYEEIVKAVRRMLNEAALEKLDEIRIVLPERKPRARKPKKAEAVTEPTQKAAVARAETVGERFVPKATEGFVDEG